MLKLTIPKVWSGAVESLADASTVYSMERDRSGKGYSSFNEGKIHDAHGALIAVVSYNGKVWPTAKWESGMQPLFDPYAAG